MLSTLVNDEKLTVLCNDNVWFSISKKDGYALYYYSSEKSKLKVLTTFNHIKDIVLMESLLYLSTEYHLINLELIGHIFNEVPEVDEGKEEFLSIYLHNNGYKFNCDTLKLYNKTDTLMMVNGSISLISSPLDLEDSSNANFELKVDNLVEIIRDESLLELILSNGSTVKTSLSWSKDLYNIAKSNRIGITELEV